MGTPLVPARDIEPEGCSAHSKGRSAERPPVDWQLGTRDCLAGSSTEKEWDTDLHGFHGSGIRENL